jgi:alpha-amylase
MRSPQRLAIRWMTIIFVVGMFACGSAQPATSVQAQSTPRTAFVHLFEWKWADIAKECENYLGPKGFAAVQVSPPNEHAIIRQSNGNYPWWERYQPVGYSIAQSRSGTAAEFQNMVTRCHNVGVDVYVDAVINHMTGGGGSGFDGTYYHGSNGSAYTKYNYPDTYADWDFHACHSDINNYGDASNVQNCELAGLSDLNTGSAYVRGKIAGYLISLANIGVRGFRIDAVKHISPTDMAAIIDQVNAAINPDPYYFQEVIDGGGEAVHASDYFGVSGGQADVTEFKYQDKLSKKFLNATYSGGYEKLAELSTFGTTWGLMASEKAIVFTANHDTERGHGGGGAFISYQNGVLNDLSHVFMLAWPYGYPSIMSSFAFDSSSTAGTDAGPPSDANGNTNSIYPAGSNTPNCFNQTPGVGWVCEHRWRPIGNMVAFRNYTASVWSTSNWWDNGNNQIAFSRGDKGFVAINREAGTLSRTFQTGLSAGTYCDVIHGDFDSAANTCSGPTVTVGATGSASISVGAMSAVAIYGGAKLPAPTTIATSFGVNATTVMGQNVYVIGNVAALGAWNTGSAVLLSSAGYPVWSGTINLPLSTSVEYKYIKKDGAGNVIWESGANRVFTTPASGTATRTGESWR